MLLFLLHFGGTLWQADSAFCLHVTAYLAPALPAVPDLPGAKWAQSAIYTSLSNNGINGLLSLHALMLNAQGCWAIDNQKKDCQNSWIVFIFLITFQVCEGSCPGSIWH